MGRRDGVVAVVEFVEVRIGVPSLVEVQDLHAVAERLLDGIDVVAEAVIGRVGHDHQPNLAAGLLGEGARRDLLLYGFARELIARDRPDDPEAVAGRNKVDRRGAGHDQRMQDGFVAVPVAEDEVALADHSMPDDFVGCGRAANDKERFIRSENARRVSLPLRDRAGVIEQGPDLADGHRNVGPQRVLAEELVEQRPDRALAKRCASAMAWRVPGIAGLESVIHQRLEHRRREAIEIELRRTRYRAGQELRRVLEQAHERVRVLQHIRRHHFGSEFVSEKEDRQPVVASALAGENLLEDLPAGLDVLRSVYRDEPA